MDCIPPLYIPYLPHPYAWDNPPCSFASWISYPMRSSWCPPETPTSKFGLLLKSTRPHTPLQTASFLQAWLYFGLLSSCLEVHIDPADLLDKEGTGRVDHGLATAAIRAWKMRFEELSQTEKEEMAKRQNEVLWIASVLMRVELDRERGSTARNATGELAEVIHGIQVLGAELLRAESSLVAIPNCAPNAVGRSGLVYAQLVQAGWCPGEIERWEKRLSPASLGWAGSLLVKEKKDKRHEGCSVSGCLALQIDEETYVTKHDEGCEGCGEFISVDTQQLEAIVKADQTPLVQVVVDVQDEGKTLMSKFRGIFGGAREPSVALQLIAHKEDMVYVAISHVWFDGLGNARENSLPRCQLRRLQRLVNNLYPDRDQDIMIPFFIDTLCIPVSHANELRKHAISRMTNTYRYCKKVLVLDTSLLSYPAPSSLLELLMRFILSHWLQRLWTLLEGAMTDSRNLQFSDRAIDIREEYGSRMRELEGKWNEPIPGDLLHNFVNFTGIARAPETQLVQHVFNSVQPRSTSHRKDEFVVVASMLAFYPEAIRKFLDIQDEEMRWKAMVDSQEWWPPEFLFLDGPRMEELGYRWCVKSFICRDEVTGQRIPRERAGSMSLPLGRKVQEGLLVKGLWGFQVVLLKQAPVASMFHALAASDGQVDAIYLVRWGGDLDDWTTLAFHTLAMPAIILPYRPGSAKYVWGALVDIMARGNGAQAARWLGIVDVSLAGPQSIKVPDNIIGETWTGCVPIGEEQIWCMA